MSDYIKGNTDVLIKQESKWGFQDMDGNYWSLSGKVNKADIKPGVRYSLSWYQKEGSKNKYISGFKAITNAAKPIVAATEVKTEVKAEEKQEVKPVQGKPVVKATTNAAASRETSIERQAVLKSVLESPVLAKLSDSVDDVEVLGTRMFNHFYKLLKSGE